MPVRKCSNGKYRIGSGDCIYTSRASAERAYAGYRAQKYGESTLRDWIDIVEQSQSTPVYESKFDRKPIPKVADVLRSEKPDMENLAEITVKYIEENCQPWLQRIEKGQVVHRSIHKHWYQTENDVVFTSVVRTNRRPTDSSPEAHRLFNKMINLAGGTANRSNSAFVTGCYKHARGYGGSVHVVMPVGNFHYTWSPYYQDWQLDADYKRHKQEWGWHADDEEDYIVDENNLKKLKKLIKADTGLPQAIESKNEIMISASKMLYIDEVFYEKYIEPIYTFG